VTLSVIALRAAGLQIIQRMIATVHQRNNVIYVVGWFAAVVAVWFVLQDYGPVAFVFGVAVFFTHCYRALARLLSFVLHHVP